MTSILWQVRRAGIFLLALTAITAVCGRSAFGQEEITPPITPPAIDTSTPVVPGLKNNAPDVPTPKNPLADPPPAPGTVSPIVTVTGVSPPNMYGMRFAQESPGRVMVTYLEPNGPADKAGVKVADQVLSLGRHTILNVADLEQRLKNLNPQEKVEFTFARVGVPYTTMLIAEQRPAEAPIVPVADANLFGMTVKEIVPGLVAVTNVAPNTPASAAGIRSGDVIVKIANHPISPLTDFMPFGIELVSSSRPGTTLPVEYTRNGVTQTVSLITGGRGAQTRYANSSTATNVLPPNNGAVILGLALRDMPPSSVVVTAVEPNSPAAAAGVAPGDTLVAVAEVSIHSTRDFLALVNLARIGDKLEFQVQRQGKSFLTSVAVVPRISDLTNATASQAMSVTQPEIQAMQQEIETLTRDLRMLVDQVNVLNGAAARTGSLPPQPRR